MSAVLRAADIHARISWPTVLETLGIEARFLRNKHQPCPACGGKDRYRFDNKHGRGMFYCNQCGPGDGFALLQRVYGWSFREARDRVLEAAGMTTDSNPPAVARSVREAPEVPAMPTSRVWRVLRSACAVANCPDAVAYLTSRKLWPLPAGCTLKAHAGIDYFDEGRPVGRFPALVAEVRDIDGRLVSAHVTYLKDGQKLTEHEPRKLLSGLTGRAGCAVRLMPLTGTTLGVAEGLETCLSAATIHRVPVWAALNTALLAKFEPPPGVAQVVVYADNDAAGLAAAGALVERLCGLGMRARLHPPSAQHKDWADVLITPGMQRLLQHQRGGKCCSNC
jgi:putative DNA primase/helicase